MLFRSEFLVGLNLFAQNFVALHFGVALHFTPKAYPEGSPRSSSLFCIKNLSVLWSNYYSTWYKPPADSNRINEPAGPLGTAGQIINKRSFHFVHFRRTGRRKRVSPGSSAKQYHTAAPHVQRSWARRLIISAAMLTAISSGVSAPIARPIGAYTRATSSQAKPSSISRSLVLATLARLPIIPM